jgi:hypothetical protein
MPSRIYIVIIFRLPTLISKIDPPIPKSDCNILFKILKGYIYIFTLQGDGKFQKYGTGLSIDIKSIFDGSQVLKPKVM